MGTCGQCQIRLLHGQIKRVKHHDFSIRQADRLRGNFLSCSYTADSPTLVIEALEARCSADIPRQHINARIKNVTQVSADIAIVSVQTPRSTRLRFLPGQNVRLTLDSEISADLPIASCPCDDRNLEFHLRRLPNDAFSGLLFKQTSFPLAVSIDGPWGEVEKKISYGPTICLSFDVHIAAIKSWIEQQLADETERCIQLYWFAAEDEFYLSKLLSSWRDAFDTFTYNLIPVQDTSCRSVDPALLKNALRQFAPKLLLVAGPDYFAHLIKRCADEVGLDEYTLWEHTLQHPKSEHVAV